MLDAILADDAQLRRVVSDELAEVAKAYGTPRRTVLLASAGQAASAAAVPLEVPDDPCFVHLSSAGLLARTTDVEPPGPPGDRATHDVVVSTVGTTARGQVGALTTAGRLIRLDVLDLPTIPPTAGSPHLQGGQHGDIDHFHRVGSRPCEGTSQRLDLLVVILAPGIVE